MNGAKNYAEELRAKARRLREEASRTEQELAQAERACTHDWSEPKYDPLVREAYTAQGHMHVGPKWIDVEVPRQVTDRWRRECRSCGKVEETTQVSERITHSPKF